MLIQLYKTGLLSFNDKILTKYEYYEIPLLDKHRDVIFESGVTKDFFIGIRFDERWKKEIFDKFIKDKIITNFTEINEYNYSILIDKIVQNIFIDLTEEELFYLKLKYPLFKY